MNSKNFKMFFASLVAFCTCCIFSQNNSFAFYPKGYEWERIIGCDTTKAGKAIEDSKNYVNMLDPRERIPIICANIKTLADAVAKNYPNVSSERCEAIARFKLLEPYLCLFFDYDLHKFCRLIETSNNENEVIQQLDYEIWDNWDAITCDEFIKYLVYDICTLHAKIIDA